LFTAFLDGLTFCFSPQAIDGTFWSLWGSGPQPGLYAADPGTLLLNVVFLQTIACSSYGTNSPLWSLAYEFWYYMLFPMAVTIVCPRIRLGSLCFAMATVGIAFTLPRALLSGGVIWLLGVLVYCLRDRTRFTGSGGKVLVVLASLAIFLGTLVASKTTLSERWLPPWFTPDLLVGISFAALALQVLWARPDRLVLFLKPVNWLSDISYSLYLFHFPMVVLYGALLRGHQFQPTVSSLAMYCLMLATFVAVSHAAWWLFERNTGAVRKAMIAVVGRSE
jgi:peptidoglycan/LPS O-acetylase OafA/YrhL